MSVHVKMSRDLTLGNKCLSRAVRSSFARTCGHGLRGEALALARKLWTSPPLGKSFKLSVKERS